MTNGRINGDKSQPQLLTWHYGLMAERWAEFITEAHEIPFFLEKIKHYGQPVMDLACGAGRILLPLLRAGIDVDGCDLSPDMLKFCRSKAEKEGFSPTLYNQPMHAFQPTRKYETILICDSFGLAGSRQEDLEALKHCYEHLEPGGALVVNIQAEYTSHDSWDWWISGKRKELPEAWPEEGKKSIASDGSEHVMRSRILEVDSLEQSFKREVRLEKWFEGKLIKSEEYTLRGNMYLKNEMLLMLKTAGFNNINLFGDFTTNPATPDDDELVFIAEK